MKKNSLLLLACLGFISSAARAADVDDSSIANCTSHQFVPRGLTEDLVLIDAITFWERHEGWHDPEQRRKSLFYATPFYQKSKKHNSNMGSAFLLNNQSNTITVAQVPPANVYSEWLGLGIVGEGALVFTSTFSINPQSRVVGTHLYSYVSLDDWLCGLWFDVCAAIVKRRNTLNCVETFSNFGNLTPGISTVTTALSNPNFMFGKFYCGDCNGDKWRTALDDIQFRLGWETSFNFCGCGDNNIVGLYVIGTAPTGRANTAEFVFEPTVGSKHGSIGVGFDGEYNFDICDNNLSLMTDFNYRYVFSHNECRTFDLTPNGPFSRFLPVATSVAVTTTVAGINFFTQEIKVKPGSTIQWWISLNYQWCDWNFEVGYDLFWREKEKVKSTTFSGEAFTPTIGIFDLGCITGPSCTTLSTATVGTFPPFTKDTTFTPITPSELNLASGLAGKVLTNKVYGAVATNGCFCECASWTAAIGGTYEFVSSKYRCSALQYWGVFGKLGLNF